jgi:hypothetical protein
MLGATLMNVYDEFADAWVDHVVFGNGNARLFSTRARMLADPEYHDSKYHRALFSAERFAQALRDHLRS